MIDFSQVVKKWLNKFDKSHVRPGTQIRLSQVTNETTPFDERDQIAAEAFRDAGSAFDPLEKAEVFVGIAEYWYQRGQMERTRECLQMAVDVYKEHPRNLHRQAVTHSLSGIVLWRLHINHAAYTEWSEAIEEFGKLAEDASDARLETNAKWYRETLDLLKEELAVMPEEARAWLTEAFGGQIGGQLKEETASLCEQVIHAVKSGVSSQADKAIRRLHEAADLRPAGLEKAEAYLECGLARHQLGEGEKAIYYLKLALSLYPPRTYQYAVASWMLGAIEWQNKQERQAFFHWQRSIETVGELMEKAGAGKADKERKQVAFLKGKQDLMKQARDRLIAG